MLCSPYPVSSSLSLLENKIALMTGDSLLAKADSNNVIDMTVSFLEMT